MEVIMQKRYENLECLRALSCIAIIAMHIKSNTNYEIGGYFYNTMIPSWTWFVYLFLIISGFSMCCGYYDKIANGWIDVEKFYIKRLKKIVPFFSCLVLLAVITEHTLDGVYEGIMEVSMVYGLLPNNELSTLGVSWTLGVIFLFYMLFPYFVFLLKNRQRAWLTFIAALFINQMCTQYFFTEKFVVSTFSYRHSFLFCTPFFVVGGMIFLYKTEIERIVNKYRVLFLVSCLVATVIWYRLSHSVLGIDIFTLNSVIMFGLWLMYAIGVKSRFMSSRILGNLVWKCTWPK